MARSELGRVRFLVIDLGGTQLRVAVADGEGNLHGRQIEGTRNVGPGPIVEQIAGLAERSLSEAELTADDMRLAVVATPGPVDPSSGIVYSAPNMVGWHDEPLEEMLEERLGMPVRLVNDANAAALGESLYGSGTGARALFYITVSTGIGGGFVLDGTVLDGVSGMAAEIGHMTIERNGPLCHCGNRGCLEALASGTSIARRFNEAVHAGQETAYRGDRPATARQVAELASAGDPLGVEIFGDAARAVGVGVVNILHLFNPDVVSIGGGVTHAGELLFGPIREVVGARAMARARACVRIVRADLGENAGLLGAAAVASAAYRTGEEPALP